jgi:hypothetical protein
MITRHKPVVTADFMFCFSLKIGFKMVSAQMLPGVLLEKESFPPALVAPHSSITLIWKIKDV